MEKPSLTQRQIANHVWEIEHRILNKAQQVQNKGNYLIWRKSLLLQKAVQGKLAIEGLEGRTNNYLNHRSRILERKFVPNKMKKSSSVDSMQGRSDSFFNQMSSTPRLSNSSGAESDGSPSLIPKGRGRGHPRTRTPRSISKGRGLDRVSSSLDTTALEKPATEMRRSMSHPDDMVAMERAMLKLNQGNVPKSLSDSETPTNSLETRSKRSSSLTDHSPSVLKPFSLHLPHISIPHMGIRSNKEPKLPVQQHSLSNNANAPISVTLDVPRNSKLDGVFEFTGMHHIFTEHTKPVTCVKFARNHKSLIAFSSIDGNISICHSTNNPRLLRALAGHTGEITDFSWSMTNEMIVSSSVDKSIRVWAVRNGDCIKVIKDNSTITRVLWHPTNQNLLVIGTAKGIVKAINISASQVIEKVKLAGSPISALEFNTNGDHLYVGDKKGVVYTFQIVAVTGVLKLVGRTQVSPTQKSITSISFRLGTNITKEKNTQSKNLGYLLINSCDNSSRLVRVDRPGVNGHNLITEKGAAYIKCTQHPIRSTYCPPQLSLRDPSKPQPDTTYCTVSGSESSSIYIYDFSSTSDPNTPPSLINELQGHTGIVFDVAWNSDGSLLASSDANGMVILWKRVQVEEDTPEE